MSQTKSKLWEHLRVVIGILLIVGLNGAFLIVGGTVIYETTAEGKTTAEISSSPWASATFEQTETDAGHMVVTATLVNASEDTVEVQLIVDSATGGEIERWTNPPSTSQSEEPRILGDESNTRLHPGDTILLRVSDGETTHTVQEYTVTE